MIRYVFVGLCVFSILQPADAADVYRWTDEAGRIHFSDSVPERFRVSAQRVRIGTPRSEAQQLQAIEAAGAERRRAMAYQAESPQTAAPSLVQPAQPSAESPAREVAASQPSFGDRFDTRDCAALYQQYWDSQACFAQYQTKTGIRAEAFKHCTEVRDPSDKCGPPIYK